MPNKDSEAALSTAKAIDRQSLAAVTPEPLRLKRGMNITLGNAFEQKGFQAEIFEILKQNHFDHVRLSLYPFQFMSDPTNNYQIDENYLSSLDWTINHCLQSGLKIIIDLHEFIKIGAEPFNYWDQFISFWEQIASRFSNYSNRLLFEILNEPNNDLDIKTWNIFLNEALKLIRETNPVRPVIIGPSHWNYITQLDTLELPEEDRNLIITFHYYEPVNFTHQGINSSWLGADYTNTIGTSWGTDEEKEFLIKNFEKAHQWGIKHNRPLYLGEFSVCDKAEMKYRVLYTEFTRQIAEKLNIGWAYWAFLGKTFGIFDIETKTWNKPLLKALIPDAPALKS